MKIQEILKCIPRLVDNGCCVGCFVNNLSFNILSIFIRDGIGIGLEGRNSQMLDWQGFIDQHLDFKILHNLYQAEIIKILKCSPKNYI